MTATLEQMCVRPELVMALALGAAAGCALTSDLGVLQRAPAEGMGGSLVGHWGIGAVDRNVVAGGVDVRGDVAAGGSRFAVGASMLGGLAIGSEKVLARAGVWHAPVSTTSERTLVPTFELAGYVPIHDHPTDPKHPEWGTSSAGVVFGVREDLDSVAYTTIFVGLALFILPGY
jgi:hypothetical protein